MIYTNYVFQIRQFISEESLNLRASIALNTSLIHSYFLTHDSYTQVIQPDVKVDGQTARSAPG